MFLYGSTNSHEYLVRQYLAYTEFVQSTWFNHKYLAKSSGKSSVFHARATDDVIVIDLQPYHMVDFLCHQLAPVPQSMVF